MTKLNLLRFYVCLQVVVQILSGCTTYGISFADGVGHLPAELSEKVRLVDRLVRDHE